MSGNGRRDRERDDVLRGTVLSELESDATVLQRMRDRRPFLFLPCPECAESFIMGFSGESIFFLPFMVGDALALHWEENHKKPR